MLAASIPTKFSIPWANNAGGSFIRPIPQASQIGIQSGAASLTDGFPPVTFSPIAAGGTPPFGQDFNGILNQITLWNRWQAAGGPIQFDGTFATAIGGYPQGAIVQSTVTIGLLWCSLVDGNIGNPDFGGANWVPQNLTTGAVQFRPTAESIPGWVVANGQTVGNGASGATGLAAAVAANLFAWLWTNFSNTVCPVAGGRGASPAADFAANKTIQLLDWRGRGFIGTDGMGNGTSGRLAGVPVTLGALTTPGSIIGENTHLNTLGETPSNISSSGVNSISVNSTTPSVDQGISPSTTGGGVFNISTVTALGGIVSTGNNTIGVTSNNTGGNPHNNVELSYTGYVYLKL